MHIFYKIIKFSWDTFKKYSHLFTSGFSKKIYIGKLVFLSTLINTVNAQNLNLSWAKRFGGPNPDIGKSIFIDLNGNVYTTGNFRSTVDFDPGPGTFNLTSIGPSDIFISKLDASGNFIWAKQIGGAIFNNQSYSIVVDAYGNVYTTGRFYGTTDFDPGAGTLNLTSVQFDVFVSKLDVSGNFIWAKQFSGIYNEEGHSIAVDGNGNVYTTGFFNETADFDPGPGTYNLTNTGGPGTNDIFVSKLDASGNFVWAKKMGGINSDYGLSLALDANANVYTSGIFYGTSDFDPGPGTYNLTSLSADHFISKLDASGNFVWAKQLGGASGFISHCITVDANGNVYTTSNFVGTADFDPGPGTYNLTSAGSNDIFISKLDVSGNFVWAKHLGGTGLDWGSSITVDANSNVYSTGAFSGTVDFDPGPGTSILTASGFFDIYISKLDILGNFLGAYKMGGGGGDESTSMAIDANGNIYATGDFNNTADFDPGPGTYNLISNGNEDIFVVKLNQSCTSIPTISAFSPTTGPVGTTVTITGINFDSNPANNIVFFGATRAAVSAATTTSLTVTVPIGATYQFITVTNACDLTAYSTQPFITTFPCGGVINVGSFAPKVDFVNVTPYFISIGDLDGDGKPDLAVTSLGSTSVSVYRNTGTIGTISFAPYIDFPTGITPAGVSIGDLDGDGKPDLAVSNSLSNTVSVLRNTGTIGTISFAPKVDFPTGNTPINASIGDLDGDGKPDLSISNQDANTISVLRNIGTNGTISFAPKVDFATGIYPLFVSTGDLDGDGKPDLAVANSTSGSVSALRNTGTIGNISFAPKIDFVVGTGTRCVSIGDLDGDGKADLAAANVFSNTVSVLRNTGTSGLISFAPKVDFATGLAPTSVPIGDVDGDGKSDLAVANDISGTISVLKNIGTSGTISFAPKIDYTIAGAATCVSIGDLDGDGKPDLAIATFVSDNVSVLRNTVANFVTPSINIATSSTTICAGTSVTFTATPTNGGTTPAYQWQVNGANVGINSPTYTSTSLANGDIVRVIMTSNANCVLPATATSNEITMTVNPSFTPAVSLTVNPAGPVCSGTLVTFTATATNIAGGTVNYNFKINGSSVQNGASNIYTTSTLTTGNTATCDITVAGGTCLTATTASSNTITVTVNPSYTPSVTITANPGGSICIGTSVTFTGTALNIAGGTVNYDFKVNGSSVQNSASNIFTTTTLANGNTVSCDITVTGGTCLTSTTAGSNTIATAVNPNSTPTVNITANPAGPVCTGTSVTFTATATGTAGGTINYDFKVNGTSVQSSASNTFTSTTLANGNTVTCDINVIGGTCLTATTASSNTITMTISATVTPTAGIVASSATICAGTSVTFTATPTNGGAAPVYQWQVNGINTGTNDATFTTNALANGDNVTVIMTSSLACAVPTTATSNTITMAVNPNSTPTVSIIANPAGPICTGTSVTFTATATSIAGGTVNYNFKVNGSSVQNNASNTFTTSTLANGNTVTCDITITGGTCLTATTTSSNIISMVVNPNSIPSLNITANPAGPICTGTSVTFTATANNTAGGTVNYNFKVNGTSVQSSTSNTFTSTALVNGNTITCDITVTGGICLTATTAASNTITISVNTTSAATLSITANPPGAICAGTSVNFTSVPVNVGTPPSFQWKLNGNNVGGNSLTWVNNNFTTGDKINCIMNTVTGCSSSPFVYSDTITMTVNPIPVILFNPSNPTISAGGSVQLNAAVTGNIAGYLWTPLTGLNNPSISNPIAKPLTTTTYNLAVISADNCSADKDLVVKVLGDIYIPNSFTPNGDGKNDIFRIPPGTSLILEYFVIYDRYGNEVFKTADINKGWDGTYKGINSLNGAYTYIIKGTDSKREIILQGTILVIR